MYVPAKFTAPSADAVEQFIKENGFATLTGYLEGKPIAIHTPIMIKESPDGDKKLVGHSSAANPQVKCFDGKQEMMAVFILRQNCYSCMMISRISINISETMSSGQHLHH